MINSFLVIRIKGQINVPHWAETTLNLFKLKRKFHATIIKKQENTIGMLHKIKNYIAWTDCEISLIKELLLKRTYTKDNQKFMNTDISKSGFSNLDELATSLLEGKTSLSKITSIKPWFALSPPRYGFKRKTKKMYDENGILGYNKDLNTLIKNMI